MTLKLLTKNAKLIAIAIAIVQLFTPVKIIAQEKDFIPSFIPPSPTAYELGKYGQIPVGMFTGTPNISIPLYEYKTKNLSVPISLSYNSNGIKVDQIESNVGLGWSLNVGGVISRIIRDKPDEKYLAYYPESRISNMQDPYTRQYFWDVAEGLTDTETDLFMFNFMGHSGKFVYDKDRKIVLMPYQDIKIEPYVNNSYKGYVITTSDGVKYYFWDIERTTSYVEGGGHPENRNEESAWYLSKIVHPLGDEIYFTYSGQSYSYITGLSQTYKYYPSLVRSCSHYHPAPMLTTFINNTTITGRTLVAISSNNSYNGQVILTSGETNQGIPGYNLISNISVKNKNLDIVEKFDFQYLTTVNNRKFLQGIVYKDPQKTYKFEYDNPGDLPERLSKSQDHWGYYNGKQNTLFVPKLFDGGFIYLDGANKEPDGLYSVKGLLTKITYPTKGYTQLSYEPNSYYGSKVINGQTATITLNASRGLHGMTYANQTFTSTHNQRVYIRASVNFNQECTDSSHTPTIDVSILENSSNTIVPLKITSASLQDIDWTGQYTSSDNGIICFADLGIGAYTFKLTAYSCSVGRSTITYQDQPSQTVLDIVETGGQRVKRVTTFDPVQNKQLTSRYYYGTMGNLNQPEADEGAKAFYLSSNYENEECEGATGVLFLRPIMVLSSSSLTSLFNTGNNNIYYRYVTVSNGGDNFENGGEQHEFILHRDSPGYLKWGKDISGAPWTNFGWDNGFEKEVKIFRKDGSNFKILQQTTNRYKQDARKYSEVVGYSVRKNFEQMQNCTEGPNYTCTAQDVTKPNLGTYPGCNAAHEHIWSDDGCIANGNIPVTRSIPNPCYGLTKDTVIVVQFQCINNLDIMEYKNLSYWSYLDSTSVKQFDNNGLNPVTTTTRYFYDNPNHVQLTRTETTGSDGKIIATRTYYPDDDFDTLVFTKRQVSLIKKLGGNKNGLYHIAEPVQIKQFVDNHITSTKRTLYKECPQSGDTLILPELIQTSIREDSLENRAKYYQYDEFGNPLEISKENDVINSFYWGYGKRYPVVKAENVSYDSLCLAINAVISSLNLPGIVTLDNLLESISEPNDIRWKNFNTNLRVHQLLKRAMVTTLTYKPMVGVTSQTDPSGVTIYYYYNDFNRLELVKDSNENILKRYIYNYKPE